MKVLSFDFLNSLKIPENTVSIREIFLKAPEVLSQRTSLTWPHLASLPHSGVGWYLDLDMPCDPLGYGVSE